MIRADLPELTAFIAIAEHQSFSGAARVLGVSPSALSHSMRNLEARLEMRLFNRTMRLVALTEAGEQLLHGVRPLLNDLTHVVNEVTSARNTPSGSIRISASESSHPPMALKLFADAVRISSHHSGKMRSPAQRLLIRAEGCSSPACRRLRSQKVMLIFLILTVVKRQHAF